MIAFPAHPRITFDERVIYKNWNAMNRGPVAKAGNTVRKIAVRSIKLRADPYEHSAVGSPPHAHDIDYAVPRFKMIYSVPDHFGTRAVVGMEGLYGKYEQGAPHLQEYGGTAYRSFTYMEKYRRRSKVTGKYIKSGRRFKHYSGIVSLPPRPFMRPALRKAIDRGYLPHFWANSLDRAYVRAA